MQIPFVKTWPGCWVGFDFDGTLATSTVWDTDANVLPLGEPIAPIVELAKAYLAAGVEVRILTARVAGCGAVNAHGVKDDMTFAVSQIHAIRAWCRTHLGQPVHVTAVKDMNMAILYDDRAVQVVRDTGRLVL